jgi:hypothetical protein
MGSFLLQLCFIISIFTQVMELSTVDLIVFCLPESSGRATEIEFHRKRNPVDQKEAFGE